MYKSLKSDFPILQKKIRNNNITYLDTASTSQKPNSVIESITNFYQNSYENVHRGMNSLSIDATEIFEASREKIKNFIKKNLFFMYCNYNLKIKYNKNIFFFEIDRILKNLNKIR